MPRINEPVAPGTEEKIRQAVVLHRKGNLGEAEQLYQEVLRLAPDHVDALHLLGVVLLQSGRFEQALIPIRRAIALDPNRAEAHHDLGFALKNRGNLDEAVSCYRRAIALKPDYVEAVINLGNVQFGQGSLDAAIASYKLAAALKPNNALVHLNLGSAFKRQGKLDEAIVSYGRSIALEATLAEAHIDLGDLLKNQGNLDDAIDCFRRAIALKPDSPEIHNALGTALDEAGKPDEAVGCFRHTLALKPDHPEALAKLASLLRKSGKLDEVVCHYRQAIAVRPDYALAWVNMGLAYFEMGDVTRAVEAADTAARFSIQELQVKFALGVLLARCDRRDEAHRLLAECLAQDPEDSQGAQMVLARIGRGPIPDHMSRAQLESIYTRRSSNWKPSSSNAPKLVADAISAVNVDAAKLDIADVGCGTGLVGPFVRGIARRLDGVDLSQAMLEKAREQGIYSNLYRADLVEFLLGRPASYDLVTSAATLIHFGDLKPVFEAAAASLRVGGLFAFTLFPNDDDGQGVQVAPLNGLGEGGCFLHGRGYVDRVARECGFSIVLMNTEIHERHRGNVNQGGLVVVLRRVS